MSAVHDRRKGNKNSKQKNALSNSKSFRGSHEGKSTDMKVHQTNSRYYFQWFPCVTRFVSARHKCNAQIHPVLSSLSVRRFVSVRSGDMIYDNDWNLPKTPNTSSRRPTFKVKFCCHRLLGVRCFQLSVELLKRTHYLIIHNYNYIDNLTIYHDSLWRWRKQAKRCIPASYSIYNKLVLPFNR